jgi:hypothetical protein
VSKSAEQRRNEDLSVKSNVLRNKRKWLRKTAGFIVHSSTCKKCIGYKSVVLVSSDKSMRYTFQNKEGYICENLHFY